MLIDDYYFHWYNANGSYMRAHLSDAGYPLKVIDSAGRTLSVPSVLQGHGSNIAPYFINSGGHVYGMKIDYIYCDVTMSFDGETVTTATGGFQTVYLWAATLRSSIWGNTEAINQPVYVYYEWYTNDALWGAMYWHSAHIYTINAGSLGASGGVLWWGQMQNYSGTLGRIHLSWRWGGVQHDEYIDFPYGTATQSGSKFIGGSI